MTPELDPLMMCCAFCNHTTHTLGCKVCGCTEGLMTGIVPAMTLPVVGVGWLAFHALNHLPVPAEEGDLGLTDQDGRRVWCCRYCCGACKALFQLREMGLLDKLLAGTGEAHGWSWWDADKQTITDGYLDNIAVRCNQCEGMDFDAEPRTHG